MSERKVLNKYFPPDFDPALIPRRKISRDKQVKVRLMTPFSMRCNTCGEYIHKGKKFNSKKEVTDEEYLGIQILRFYIRCNRCSAELTFKTDPKNNDYAPEHGIQRRIEPWYNAEGPKSEEEAKKNEETDPIKLLEDRTKDSKIEMDVMDALDGICALNSRIESVGSNRILEKIMQEGEEASKVNPEEDMRDTQLARQEFMNRLKKVEEEDVDDIKSLVSNSFTESVSKKRRMDSAKSLGVMVKKKPKT